MKHRRLQAVTLFAAVLAVIGTAFAQDTSAPAPADPRAMLAKFWEAYTAGDGLTYVVIQDGQGERVYRYGNVSRMAAKKDPRGFVLFTCNAPHVFVVDEVEDQADLLNAKVVKAGEPGFVELDAKYLTDCRNPWVKSAIPRDTK